MFLKPPYNWAANEILTMSLGGASRTSLYRAASAGSQSFPLLPCRNGDEMVEVGTAVLGP